ncbi:hypothetical protein EO087_03525 [Dyella sp. M7H15-1]|uniref:hypothetical protein n=1 Tax=Dyella sp. M7H15-1 TaxID=2501295 RepID=UPI001004FFAD|nr:hypothetical protein [Dyella sp. M7H15-1]QAU23176.1 hypothetical protein EO087_03525 [Dyella sp. M7H15-1]
MLEIGILAAAQTNRERLGGGRLYRYGPGDEKSCLGQADIVQQDRSESRVSTRYEVARWIIENGLMRGSQNTMIINHHDFRPYEK